MDVNTFNFSSEDDFLKVINKTKADYLRDVVQTKEAAKRLVAKYNLSSQTPSTECISCKSDQPEELAKLRRVITQFKTNKEVYAKFQQLLLTPNVAAGGGGGGGSACCGLRFYACALICAETIAVFPVYLACCAFCYDSYCCK